MNNKNFNSLYGGNFNNLKNMLEEEVSDTSDYNVSLLNQIQGNQNNKTGGVPKNSMFSLGNLASLTNPASLTKFANQASAAMNTAEKLANQATNVINKAEAVATKSQSAFNKITGDTINNCITTAKSMNPEELKLMIAQLQEILNNKLKNNKLKK